MADQKTIGQILRDAEKKWIDAYEERGAYDPNWREPCSEAAASAVWNEAVEACIEAIEEETWRTKGADFSKSDLLRSLKRSDKTESDNG